MKTEIGAYEAKTRLPELLREVRAGRSFTITNRGEAVADLVPSEDSGHRDPAGAVGRFLDFMAANPVKGRVSIRAVVAEGRE